jgi:hypothetical protein
MNNEMGRTWKEKTMAYFEIAYYPGICLEGLKKTTKYSRYPVFGPGFNPRTSLIRSRDANHSAATFSDMCTVSRKNHMVPAIHCLVEAESFASYQGKHWFESLPGDRLSWQIIFYIVQTRKID